MTQKEVAKIFRYSGTVIKFGNSVRTNSTPYDTFTSTFMTVKG